MWMLSQLKTLNTSPLKNVGSLPRERQNDREQLIPANLEWAAPRRVILPFWRHSRTRTQYRRFWLWEGRWTRLSPFLLNEPKRRHGSTAGLGGPSMFEALAGVINILIHDLVKGVSWEVLQPVNDPEWEGDSRRISLRANLGELLAENKSKWSFWKEVPCYQPQLGKTARGHGHLSLIDSRKLGSWASSKRALGHCVGKLVQSR